MQMAIKCCDLKHPTLLREQHLRWSEMVNEEFIQQDIKETELYEFLQWQLEIHPHYKPFKNPTMVHKETTAWVCDYEGTNEEIRIKVEVDMRLIKGKWLERALAWGGYEEEDLK